MKVWMNPEVCELKLNATAFGPQNPDQMDEAKYAVTDEKGNILGWKQGYGEGSDGQS